MHEVADLPLELHPKTLGCAAGEAVRTPRRLSALHVDVRVIAATNRDLKNMVEGLSSGPMSGNMREF
jgi:transcriptional regulator with GAF, ATPase, and Fis domain